MRKPADVLRSIHVHTQPSTSITLFNQKIKSKLNQVCCEGISRMSFNVRNIQFAKWRPEHIFHANLSISKDQKITEKKKCLIFI